METQELEELEKHARKYRHKLELKRAHDAAEGPPAPDPSLPRQPRFALNHLPILLVYLAASVVKTRLEIHA